MKRHEAIKIYGSAAVSTAEHQYAKNKQGLNFTLFASNVDPVGASTVEQCRFIEKFVEKGEPATMEKTVYVVLKNADFTEGRGPMLFNSVWDNLPAAEAFVMSQYGICGSKQGKERDGVDPTYRSYNGFVIRQVELLSRFNPQAKKDAEERFKKASEEMRHAEAELKKFQ